MVILISEPGTYKIIWDNGFSWVTAKKLRYRVSVLRPMEKIDPSKAPVIVSNSCSSGSGSGSGSGNSGNNNNTNIITIKSNQVEMTDKYNTNATTNNTINNTNNSKSFPPKNESRQLQIKISSENKTLEIDTIHDRINNISNNTNNTRLYAILTAKHIKLLDTGKKEITYELENNLSNLQSIVKNSINTNNLKKIELNLLLTEKNHMKLDYEPLFEELESEFKVEIFVKIHDLAVGIITHGIYSQYLVQNPKNNNQSNNSNNLKFENRLHINIEPGITSQVAMYFEGVVHNKISGFKYEAEKSIFENSDNILEFINKLTVVFGDFKLTFSSLEINIPESFIEQMNKKLSSNEISLELEIFSKERLVEAIVGIPEMNI